MKRNIHALLIVAAVAALALAPATTARAQTTAAETTKVLKPFRIKLGAFFPTDGRTKDRVGDTLFSYGVSYDFGKSRTATPLVYSVYFDGFTGSQDENHLTSYGFGVGLRYIFTPVVAPVHFYGGVGIGPYIEDTKDKANGSKTGTVLGGKLFAGAEMNQGLFGELSYNLISEVKDYKPSGWGIAIGYRF